MSGEPWWMSGLRLFTVVALAAGAWNGFTTMRRAQADKKAQKQAANSGEPPRD